MPTSDRHPATTNLLRWFGYEHLRDGLPKEVSKRVALTAHDIAGLVADHPELSEGLRKLLEAKDCLVRAAIAHTDKPAEPAEPEVKGEPAKDPDDGPGWHRGSSLASSERAGARRVREPDTIVFGFGRRENW